MPEAMGADRLLPLKAKLGLLDSASSIWSISKVPNTFRSLKEVAYSPQIVSIGPYHHGKGNLRDMEEHKLQYVLTLLHRTKNPVETLNDCGKAIQNLDQRVRECYADDIDHFDATELLEILMVDGCFITELLYRHAFPQETNLHDPIANTAWMVSSLRHDLALLENQIPFFILVQLYNVFRQKLLNIPPENSLPSLALSFFHPKMDVMQESISTEPNHLLDLLHKFWLPKSGIHPSGNETRGFDLCASQLLEAGIKFEKNESRHLLDIEFDGDNGVIKIPPLSIDAIESLLRNLIALEQCSLSNSFHVSSYALMMRSLLRSPPDVELLQQKGIITCDLERGQSVWFAIDGIYRNVVTIKHFYFGKLCKDVKAYRESRWHWQRHKAIWTFRSHIYLADLKRDYFSNPWKTIAVLVALVMLLLTGVQTFYTVRSYYPH